MALLMASLPRMGPNAHLAKRVLKGLAAHVPGRMALRHAAAKWQAQLAQQQGAPAPPGQANKEALKWAATQLWQMGVQPSASPVDSSLLHQAVPGHKFLQSPLLISRPWR